MTLDTRKHAVKATLHIKSKFHGHGFEASLGMLKGNIDHAEKIELFSSEKIVFLDIKFGELFHRCTSEEWGQFLSFLNAEKIVSLDYKFPWNSLSWRLCAVAFWFFVVTISGDLIQELFSGKPGYYVDIIRLVFIAILIFLVLGMQELMKEYAERLRIAKLVKTATVSQ